MRPPAAQLYARPAPRARTLTSQLGSFLFFFRSVLFLCISTPQVHPCYIFSFLLFCLFRFPGNAAGREIHFLESPAPRLPFFVDFFRIIGCEWSPGA